MTNQIHTHAPRSSGYTHCGKLRTKVKNVDVNGGREVTCISCLKAKGLDPVVEVLDWRMKQTARLRAVRKYYGAMDDLDKVRLQKAHRAAIGAAMAASVRAAKKYDSLADDIREYFRYLSEGPRVLCVKKEREIRRKVGMK